MVVVEGQLVISLHLMCSLPPSLPPPLLAMSQEKPSGAGLVTAAGTYATQSAFTATSVKKEEKM